MVFSWLIVIAVVSLVTGEKVLNVANTIKNLASGSTDPICNLGSMDTLIKQLAQETLCLHDNANLNGFVSDDGERNDADWKFPMTHVSLTQMGFSIQLPSGNRLYRTQILRKDMADKLTLVGRQLTSQYSDKPLAYEPVLNYGTLRTVVESFVWAHKQAGTQCNQPELGPGLTDAKQRIMSDLHAWGLYWRSSKTRMETKYDATGAVTLEQLLETSPSPGLDVVNGVVGPAQADQVDTVPNYSPAVRAFQVLWNFNNDGNQSPLPVNGILNQATFEKISDMDVSGFAKIRRQSLSETDCRLAVGVLKLWPYEAHGSLEPGQPQTLLTGTNVCLPGAETARLPLWSSKTCTGDSGFEMKAGYKHSVKIASGTAVLCEGSSNNGAGTWYYEVQNVGGDANPTDRFFVDAKAVNDCSGCPAQCPNGVVAGEPLPGEDKTIVYPDGCNGVAKEPEKGEECDPDRGVSDAPVGGCVACRCVPGWEPSIVVTNQLCVRLCGNGILNKDTDVDGDGTAEPEECERGVAGAVDQWCDFATCRCAYGFQPDPNPNGPAGLCVPFVRPPTCGNQQYDAGEQCELLGENCSADCRCKPGFQPTNPASKDCEPVPNQTCGNGGLDQGEQCDSGPGCSSTCQCRVGWKPVTGALQCAVVKPDTCGNYNPGEPGERCDGGTGCATDCTCKAGYEAYDPPLQRCRKQPTTQTSSRLVADARACIKTSVAALTDRCGSTEAFYLEQVYDAVIIQDGQTITECGTTWIKAAPVDDLTNVGWINELDLDPCTGGPVVKGPVPEPSSLTLYLAAGIGGGIGFLACLAFCIFCLVIVVKRATRLTPEDRAKAAMRQDRATRNNPYLDRDERRTNRRSGGGASSGPGSAINSPRSGFDDGIMMQPLSVQPGYGAANQNDMMMGQQQQQQQLLQPGYMPAQAGVGGGQFIEVSAGYGGGGGTQMSMTGPSYPTANGSTMPSYHHAAGGSTAAAQTATHLLIHDQNKAAF